MGYAEGPHRSPLEAFKADYKQKTERNRKILNYLLSDAFGEEAEVEPEVDLVLDPDPPAATVPAVLGRYGFQKVATPTRTCWPWPRDDLVPLLAPLPALPGGHRAQAAAGDRRHARPRLDAGQLEQGQRFAGRQRRAVGAVQLQPADRCSCTSACAPPRPTWPAS